ncbi:MAG: hypothetical protein U5L07_09695 [Desulfobacterales bacterium]|nr:hypothetical protein [Desulfobacterales bacterium]
MNKPVVTAIPVCCNRVAFHFAWCSHVLLVETIGDRVLGRRKRPMPYEEPWDLARTLVALNIDQLLCRFMPLHFRDWFERKQVRVIDCDVGDTRLLPEPFGQEIEEAECARDTADSGPDQKYTRK